MFNKSLCVSCLLWLALACWCCSVSGCKSRTAHSDAVNRDPESQGSSHSPDVTDMVFPQPTYPEELKEAWRRFVDGRYRMAQADEFSENARHHFDSYGGIYLPLLFDINGDRGYDDYAVIVVDTKRNDDARFGLVIFSAPEAERRVFNPSWVFRERDLSRVALSRASARLVLTEYREDGSQQSCFVRWHARQGRYTCDQQD